MVWMTCVAVHFAMESTFQALFPAQMTAEESFFRKAVLGLAGGVYYGTALAGVVLLAVRRLARQAFPVHPGEFLWVVGGLSYLFRWIGISIVLIVWWILEAHDFSTTWVVVNNLPPELLRIALCCWAIVRLTDILWRSWWGLYLACCVLGTCTALVVWSGLGSYAVNYYWYRLVPVVGAAIATVFLAAVLRDWKRRRHYPWTHWAGIALAVWRFSEIGILLLARFHYGI